MSRPAPARVRTSPREANRRSPLPPAVFAMAALAVVLEMAFSTRYGYHRDELYFLQCARRLAWGYVDQPPLTPALARLGIELFGGAVWGLRLFPALSVGLMVLVGGLMARELGASRWAQGLAALSVGLTGVFLGAGHLLSTTAFDFLFWGMASWLLIRLIRTGDVRLWMAIGLVVGIGLENKWTILFWVFGLAAGLLLTEQRRVLATPWVLGGIAVAALLWAPNLVWQASHGWPVIGMSKALHRHALEDGNMYFFAPAQLLYAGPLLAPIFIAGLVRLFRGGQARPYRAFALGYMVLFVLFEVTAGKPYYIDGLFPVLYGAGAMATGDWLARRGSGWITRGSLVPAIVVAQLLPLPIGLPVLPAAWLHTVPLQNVNYDLGETIGWPELVRDVAAVYRSVPAAERGTTTIFTGNYGEAGAIERYGPALGLPQPYSGHNNEWLWGPPPASATTVVLVGSFEPSYLKQFFTSFTQAGTIRNDLRVNNEEAGQAIWLARGLRAPWATMWPDLQHYD